MVVKGPFLSSCEEGAGEKVKGNKNVNLEDLFLTSKRNYRANSPVNVEEDTFPRYEYDEVPGGSSERSKLPTSSVNHREDSPVSSEEEFLSCNEDNEISDDSSEESEDFLPTKEQKFEFFKLLKRLLEDQCLLQERMKRRCQYNQDTLKLVYMKETCEVILEDSSRRVKWRHTVKTKDIYLQWRFDHEETLSVENLNKVWSELGILNIQSDELKACFSLARISFNNELVCLQKNTKLLISHGDVSLIFVSGKGENRAKVLYDDNENKPVYTMEVAHGYTILANLFYRFFCRVGEILGNIGPCLTAIKNFLNMIAQAMKQKNAKYKAE